MEREYERTATLAPPTVAVMYGTYGLYTTVLAWAARAKVWKVDVAPGVARPVGAAVTATGAGFLAAGASRFTSAAQLTGTDPGGLHTVGVYRVSRNPQYLGNALIVTGAAVASRSGYAAALAAGVWATYRRWIRTEGVHLSNVFGPEYEAYTGRVRRWLGVRPAGHGSGAPVVAGPAARHVGTHDDVSRGAPEFPGEEANL